MNDNTCGVPPECFTIGHSTRPLDEFLQILDAYAIQELVDVRTIPRSRHNPQFDKEALASAVSKQGIIYAHTPALGGLRKPKKDSINTGWKNASFRGYADYMQTPEFNEAVDALIGRLEDRRLCLMCAEAVPWRCHRSLIADALTVRGVKVTHILDLTHTRSHEMTTFAKVEGLGIVYRE